MQQSSPTAVENGVVPATKVSSERRLSVLSWSRLRRIENVAPNGISSGGSSGTAKGGRFTRSTSNAWEKISNAIRRPRAAGKERRLAELEPRVQECETGVKRIYDQIDQLRKINPLLTPLAPPPTSRHLPSSCPNTANGIPRARAGSEGCDGSCGIAEVREELLATLAELKETHDRYGDLQLSFCRECEERAKAEGELEALRETTSTPTTEQSLTYFDASENFQASSLIRKESKNGTYARELIAARQLVQQLQRELKQQRQAMEVGYLEEKEAEYRVLLRDMLTAVRVAQNFKEEAEAEVARCHQTLQRSASIAEREELALWTELRKGRIDSGSRRNALLAWAKETLASASWTSSLPLSNFSASWADGRVLCALIHIARPSLVSKVEIEAESDCCELAERLCSKLHLPNPRGAIFREGLQLPDWKATMQLVLQLYKMLYFKSEGEQFVTD